MLVALMLLLACAKDASPTPAPEPSAPAAATGTSAPATSAGAPTSAGTSTPPSPGAESVLTGTVLKKPWSKSVESWNAGGSDYYVLDVGGAPVAETSADEGVILRPTDAVTVDALAAAVGKKVEVHGHFVPATTPHVDPTSQYPMGPDGQPLPSGGGFSATSLKVVE